MSRLIASAREKYLRHQFEACRSCAAELGPLLGVSFSIAECSGRALEAVETQWEPAGRNKETRWDWREVIRRHKEPDRLEIAIWSSDRLSGLGLALTGGDCVTLSFLEGDPRPDCPLKGRRVLIALDAAARYAQVRGRAEIRVRPINSALERLYVKTYGFEKRSPKGEEPHFFKRV